MEKPYDTKGMKETCLNCGKEECALAGVGNVARENENNGCWVPSKASIEYEKAIQSLIEYARDVEQYHKHTLFPLMQQLVVICDVTNNLLMADRIFKVKEEIQLFDSAMSRSVIAAMGNVKEQRGEVVVKNKVEKAR
jgi:hypothetical protein